MNVLTPEHVIDYLNFINKTDTSEIFCQKEYNMSLHNFLKTDRNYFDIYQKVTGDNDSHQNIKCNSYLENLHDSITCGIYFETMITASR